jgi:hypothetical protein
MNFGEGKAAILLELERSTNEIERLRKGFSLLLQMQGEIHPGWNDEYIPARWVYELAEKALNVSSYN